MTFCLLFDSDLRPSKRKLLSRITQIFRGKLLCWPDVTYLVLSHGILALSVKSLDLLSGLPYEDLNHTIAFYHNALLYVLFRHYLFFKILKSVFTKLHILKRGAEVWIKMNYKM